MVCWEKREIGRKRARTRKRERDDVCGFLCRFPRWIYSIFFPHEQLTQLYVPLAVQTCSVQLGGLEKRGAEGNCAPRHTLTHAHVNPIPHLAAWPDSCNVVRQPFRNLAVSQHEVTSCLNSQSKVGKLFPHLLSCRKSLAAYFLTAFCILSAVHRKVAEVSIEIGTGFVILVGVIIIGLNLG